MRGQRVGRGSQGRDRQLEDRGAGLTNPDAHNHLSNVENSSDDCPLVIFNMPRFYQMCTYREICDLVIQQPSDTPGDGQKMLLLFICTTIYCAFIRIVFSSEFFED